MESQYIPAPPVKIPELGLDAFDANCCINPICDNFGVSWHKTVQDKQSVYNISGIKGVDKLACKKCKSKTTLHNNESINKIFLWALKNTLSHEYCPNNLCANHRVNFYENSKQYYNNNIATVQIECKLCNKRFTIGAATRLTKKNKDTKRLLLFLKLVCNNTGPRGVVDILETSSKNYYSSLKVMSALTKEVSAYYLMQLNNHKHSLKNDCINIYTDIFKVSIHSPNNYKRNHELLDYVVSSTNYNDSFVILAATPAFMPDTDIDKNLKSIIEKDIGLTDYPTPSHLNELYGIHTESNSKTSSKFFPIGIGGYYLRINYVLIAHFLLLNKILSNIKHINHYSDAERIISISAMLGFANRIKNRTFDTVSVKTKKGKSSQNKDKHSAPFHNIDDKKVNKQYIDNISRTCKIIQDKSINNYSSNKLWVKDPKPPIHEQNRRFLWITRQDNVDVDYEINLYKNAKLQPIDMPFAVLRMSSSFSKRPTNVSSTNNARGYVSLAELPKNACDEIRINFFYWNFQLRHGSKRKETRGYALGISPKKPINMEQILNWRNGIFNRLKSNTGE